MKKHQNADLEKKRIIFFQLGLMVALATTLLAFEWTHYSHTASFQHATLDAEYIESELINPVKRFKKPLEKVDISNTKVIIDKFNIKDKDPDDGQKKKTDDFDIAFFTITGDCLDCDDIPEDPLVVDVNRVQMKPYYMECEDVTNLEAQANCSYYKIKEYINENAKYPSIAKEGNIKGRVWMSFVVDTKGEITDVKVEQGVHALLDKEATKAVSMVPKMIPAKQMGKSVPVRFMIPVDFIIK